MTNIIIKITINFFISLPFTDVNPRFPVTQGERGKKCQCQCECQWREERMVGIEISMIILGFKSPPDQAQRFSLLSTDTDTSPRRRTAQRFSLLPTDTDTSPSPR